MKQRLGEILIEQGKVDQSQVDRALRLQQDERSGRIGEILLRLGLVTEVDLVQALSAQSGIPVAEAADYPELPLFAQQLSHRYLRDANALPLREDGKRLTVAVADPFDTFLKESLGLATGRSVDFVLATPGELQAAFDRLYGTGKSSMDQIVGDIEMLEDDTGNEDLQQLKDLASEAPVIRLVSLIISRAMEARASDIHVEPFENRLIVRYRIDGVLHEVESPPRRLSAAVISRIKIMASLDIAERRLPQDGRIKLRIHGKEADLRVSTVPTLYGESVVMRILDKSSTLLDFDRLGFDAQNLSAFKSALMQPHGILLVTGPTGSGKTTTLYTALQTINQPDLKILTVEDPVEYQMDGINQIQVKPQIGLTFANALRSIVRQDPDVIMVGEIRDLETAQIAVQSALTGHMVLSTLHTNDAASTINRLLDMGMEDYLLTSTIVGVQAQRLVRNLCMACRQPYTPTPELLEEIGLQRYLPEPDSVLYHSKGCELCGGTGFIGRSCIVEVLLMNDTVRQKVMTHATSGEIRRVAVEQGMETMYENGLRKVTAGLTTLEEVLRATREE
ncbi:MULTISPECIES: type II secretion system ATPase GspE [unclassified Thiomonas]|uniref:type II secretion system ATPase GspE n=1 Tax=unclassified Thiomonas TaxID=2625466 RepID=UPI0004DBC5FF|nr:MULTISPECIES: type II secretion system ATPase GspE [unclassified Thiomonas]CDW92766.1 Type II secretion system protein E (GspE) [Thiomonas sp. CB2]VDY05533.1 Type II secretion system protein E [Thiomonas sp. Bio17B3]VDY07303.1 Type II secretion system protein E [Thiomonas sp. Sup16B3]VDY13787.1 Type II secretion system protein E [Thiomonas sp. OC7]VDY17013.1 Type II secretion system protein E (GspE) [Thiomonas sp. CB2]